MFLALLTSAGVAGRIQGGAMDMKIYAVMLLIGFLSTLYHVGKPEESAESKTA
jgi:DMSO reductase anchor subunit